MAENNNANRGFHRFETANFTDFAEVKGTGLQFVSSAPSLVRLFASFHLRNPRIRNSWPLRHLWFRSAVTALICANCSFEVLTYSSEESAVPQFLAPPVSAVSQGCCRF